MAVGQPPLLSQRGRCGYKAVSSLPADSQSHAQRVHIELRLSAAALALFILTA